MGLAWIGHYRVAGPLTAGHLFYASDRIGASLRSLGHRFSRPKEETRLFTILER
jgi:hypothetical protein